MGKACWPLVFPIVLAQYLNYFSGGTNHGQTTIKTVLTAEKTYQVTHYLVWRENSRYIKIFCSLENRGQEEFALEMFESVSIGGLSPYLEGDGH